MCSYKTVYLNTYNVMSIDMGKDEIKGNVVVSRHESFQLWESESKGILLTKHKDYISLNKSGIQILNMGGQTKSFVDHDGMDKMVHSMESCDYLKLIPDNHILLECAKPEERMLSISQENRFNNGDERIVEFQILYKIRLWNLTLRELLLLKSLYLSKTLSEIVELV